VNRVRAHTGPLWPYLVLIAVPFVGFVLPDLISGRLIITGDNLQQNYPLHVLVGDMLRHGQLPFWNQYIFSGTPLMADFNAGAFYPLMGFFVALPDRAAWIATEVVLFSGIGISMYVFLRALKLSTMACVVAAATFAFAGPVLSQVNHVDMTEGFLAIPWMLLAVHHIVRDGRWRWSILLGIAFASVILAGAPEAMLDEALLVLAFAVMSAGLNAQRWWRVLSRGATGAVLALSLAAIQWLPGLEAIRNSQRGSGVFAAAGSFPNPFNILWLVPYINGGYGHLGEAQFFSQYNLPEVGVYLGILPLVAVITLLHPRWPSRIGPRDRLTWYVVGVFGYLLALGSNTPLEHLFNSLPLYGHQRLQSRNMITVATAACVLFAGWLDRSERPQVGDAMTRYERVMGLVPFGLLAALGVWTLISPAGVVQTFAGISIRPSIASTVREAVLIALLFCAGAAAVVWLRARLSTSWWRWVAAVFVAVDLGVMALTSQLTNSPPNDLLSGSTPVQQLMAAHLPAGSRLVNYDPQTYDSYPGSPQGIPDLNIIPRLPSVSGYASIVNGTYENATHTHTQNDLDLGQLSSGALDQLNLREVVSLPEYFLVPLAAVPDATDSITQVQENFGTDPVLPRGYGADYNDTAYPFYPGDRPGVSAGRSESWFFGEPLGPTAATVLLSRPATAGTSVRFGVLRADGSTRWGRATAIPSGATRATMALPSGTWVGLSLQVLGGSIPSQRVVVTAEGAPYELDGSLSSALRPGPWRVAGFSQGFAVFTSVRPSVSISAATTGGRAVPVQVLSSSTKSEEIRVRAPAGTVVIRSVAWDPGWKGTVSVNGGPARSVTVQSHDLVQQIRVPPGDDLVSFHYRPPHLLVASVLSIGSVIALLALFVGWVVVRRRRRDGPTDVPGASDVGAAPVPEDQTPGQGDQGAGEAGRHAADPEASVPSVLRPGAP
jgi:hypothetical protein